MKLGALKIKTIGVEQFFFKPSTFYTSIHIFSWCVVISKIFKTSLQQRHKLFVSVLNFSAVKHVQAVEASKNVKSELVILPLNTLCFQTLPSFLYIKPW